MAALYTKTQHEAAQEELIAAYEGFIPRNGNQYENHGIYLIDKKSNDFEIAVLKALNLPFEHLKTQSKPKVNFVAITKAHQKIRSSSKDLVNDQIFKQCHLLRSLNTLPPLHQAWFGVVYQSENSDHLVKMMTDVATRTFKIRKGGEDKFLSLIQYAVHQSIAHSLNRNIYDDREIALGLGVTPAAYNSNWKARLIIMSNILTEIDNNILDIACHTLGYPQYKPSLKSKNAHLFDFH